MTNETPMNNTATTNELTDAQAFIEMTKTHSKEECNAYITNRFGEFGTEGYDEAGHVAFSNEVLDEVAAQSVPQAEANEDNTVKEATDVADTAEVEAVESTN